MTKTKTIRRTNKGFYVDPIPQEDARRVITWYNAYVDVWNLLEGQFQRHEGDSPSDLGDMMLFRASFLHAPVRIWITRNDTGQSYLIRPARGVWIYQGHGLSNFYKNKLDPETVQWVRESVHLHPRSHRLGSEYRTLLNPLASFDRRTNPTAVLFMPTLLPRLELVAILGDSPEAILLGKVVMFVRDDGHIAGWPLNEKASEIAGTRIYGPAVVSNRGRNGRIF